jgi:hypothetical protein
MSIKSNISPPQADKITTLIKAAKVEGVEPIWATLFAKVLEIASPSLKSAL